MIRIILHIAFLIVLTPSVVAQQLEVHVVDGGTSSEQPVEGVWVVAHATGIGAQTDADGVAWLSDTGGGVVSAQKPGWTSALFSGEPVTTTLRLFRGDVNGDGQVDLVDVAALVDYTPQDLRSSFPAFDFDGDGVIGRGDLEAVAASTSHVGSPATYVLIDDAEDDDARSELPRGSFWQAFSDETYNGGNSTTSPPSLTPVTPTDEGVYGSDGSISYSYTLGAAYPYRFAMLRLLMTEDDAIGVDATGYSGIEFWLKGNGVPMIVSLKSGPTSDDFHEFEHRIESVPEEWTRYRLSFEGDFTLPGWGQTETIQHALADLEAIQFKTLSGTVGEQGEIWVDNVAFLRRGGPSLDGVLAGQIRDESGAGVPFARVNVAGTTNRRVLTDGSGNFVVDVPPGEVTVTAEKAGYEAGSDVATVVTGLTTDINISIDRSVQDAKPGSTGPVRLDDHTLQTDFDGDGSYDPFFVKGAAFSVAPIGSWGAVNDTRIFDRASAWLDTLNANTIRTYSGINRYMMDEAAEREIRTILGFWISYEADFSDALTRENIISDFRQFVRQHKDHPGLLMWTLGNEQNYQNGNNAHWYDLAQELAIAAFEEEGERYHPVSINNGGIYNIGDAAFHADDASLTYVDVWASNVYMYDLTVGFFSPYRALSGKPVVVTEFGIDALDNRTRTEYEEEQAEFDRRNWQQIVANSDVGLGATVFEFTDEWWKDGDPNSHDYGGYPTGAHPDGYSNEEWWGIVAVTPDADGDGLDEWRARDAYFMFQDVWQEEVDQ